MLWAAAKRQARIGKTGGIGMKRQKDKRRKKVWQKAVCIGTAAFLCCALLPGCGKDNGAQQGLRTAGEEAETLQGHQTEGESQGAASGQQEGGAPEILQGQQTAAEYVRTDTLDETLMESTNGFAFHFGERLSADGENYFFSPYSICSALAVLDNAAGGATKEQIEAMLGITDLSHYNQQLSFYMQKPQHAQANVQSANSLWINKNYPLADAAYTDYLPLVGFYYDAEIWKADFAGNPIGTRDEINRWVEERTGGMIPHFKEEVDPGTAIAIINAVYFYGEWSFPFEANETHEQTFHGQTQDTVVSMMNQVELYLPYYEQGGLCGISVPYGDGSVVMNLLLAEDAGQSTAELFGAMSDEEKNDFLMTLMNRRSMDIWRLAIPKFTMDYSVSDMSQILEELGMENAFYAGRADFRGLADPETAEFHVSDVNHVAKLEVDELGSRAAAVTEIATNDGAAMWWGDTVSFVADRPFLFFIQDKETGMILFMGEVRDL